MSLADNLKTAQAERGQTTPPPAPVATLKPGELSPQHGQTVAEVMNSGLPGHETAEVAAPAPETPTAAPAQEKIKIGTETFENIADAMNYAQQLATDKVERDAYEQGKQDAQPQTTEPQLNADDEFYKQMSELMFENPAEAVKQIEVRAVEKATSTIKADTAQTRSTEKTWNKFYDDHKDLTVHRDMVDFVLEKNWSTLGPMQPEKALQKLADLTRGRIQEIVQAARPEEVLPAGSTQVTTTSGEPVAQVVQQKQKLDFTQQIRKLNRREMKDLL